MTRSHKYIDYCKSIADSLLFLENSNAEKLALQKDLDEYLNIVTLNKEVLNSFPLLLNEIRASLNLKAFNTQTSAARISELRSVIPKLEYIHQVLKDMEMVKDEKLSAKVSLNSFKEKFIQSAGKVTFRSAETLRFEVQNFEQLFKKHAAQLNDERNKCGKVRSLLNQDRLLIAEFPVIENELSTIASGNITGTAGPDYVITNYPAIRGNLTKISEFSKYFSKLSADYASILEGYDLQVFGTSKSKVSVSHIAGEFLRLNTLATELKNRMIKLDTLRNSVNNLRREVNGKFDEISPNHQSYVRQQMAEINELLFDKPGRHFEKAEPKINTVREILKKQFVSNDQRAGESLLIRQMISKYENEMWQEDATALFEDLNKFANGSSHSTKEEFFNRIQQCVRDKNEIIATARKEFELFFSKNRDYKNRFEKIANTKCPKQELQNLLKAMNSFRPLKEVFYRFIK